MVGRRLSTSEDAARICGHGQGESWSSSRDLLPRQRRARPAVL